GGAHLRARLGLRRGAWRPGATDGVGFEVHVVGPDGAVVAYRRFLDPVRVEADRGPQSLDLALTLAAPGEVVLVTEPGPAKDVKWDWSYWTDVRLEPSATGTALPAGAP